MRGESLRCLGFLGGRLGRGVVEYGERAMGLEYVVSGRIRWWSGRTKASLAK